MKTRMLELSVAVALLSAGCATADPIEVFDWSGYDDPGFFGAYVGKYGNPPSFSFFADDHEGFNKLSAGFQADLMHPCLGVMPKLRASGLIEPIDVSRIPA